MPSLALFASDTPERTRIRRMVNNNRAQFLGILEKEHEAIKNIFNGIKPVFNNGKIKDARRALAAIQGLRQLLAGHLNREDDQFYPDMREKAIELEQLALLPALDVFVSDMRGISKKIFYFFETYKDEAGILADEAGFISGFSEVRALLLKRIMSEEKTLYHIYKAYYGL